MEFFKKKKTSTIPIEDNNNFNRSPLRSQSQCTVKKRSASRDKDATLSRSQTFTIGLPVYSIENDPLGTAVDGPLSQASSGYLSINGEVTSPTDSNVSLFSEQKSDYGGSTSEVSGVSSVDSETLNIIYASRYHALKRQSQTLEKVVPVIKVQSESVPFPGCQSSGIPSSTRRREQSRSSSRGDSVSRHDSIRSTNSSGSQSTSRSDSVRSSKSSRSVDSGHSSRVRSPDSQSVRSYRSSSSSTSSTGSSSSRVSRVRYGDSGRSRHSKIPEEPSDPYFTKGICSSFREDGSAEVRVRGSPDFEQAGAKVVRRDSRSNSFRRSRPCLSMLRDHRDTQSLEGLDRIEGESTLDRKSRRDARSVGNLVQVSVPTVPSDYQSAGTLRRNAKSVGNLIGHHGREAHLESSHSTGDLLNEAPSGERNGNKKDAFFKRGIFKLFRKKSDSEKAKKEKSKSKLPKSKSSTLDYESRRGSTDTLTNVTGEIIDTKSKYDTIQSKTSTLCSREGTLTRANVNVNADTSRERNGLRDSRDFDRNDSLERAIRSNDQSATLTRENCNDRLSKDLTEDPYGKVGALNAILRQSKSPSIIRKRALPPVPPNRTSRSKSTYQILDEIKAQNIARSIESQPIPDDPPSPVSPLPPSPVAGVLKRTVQARDSKSLGVMAQKSDTLKRHNSRNLENLEDSFYDLPPPPEELIAMGVDAPRPNDLPIGDKPLRSCLKSKTPIEELRSPRELKNALNEPFYARSQQRRSRPNCPPPVPPHGSEKVVLTQVKLVHQEGRHGNEIGQQLRNVRLRPTADRPPVPVHQNPPVPVHQNLNLKSEIQAAKLRKRPETKPKTNELETVLQNSLKRRSQGNVLDNNINEEIRNVVLRRTSPTQKEPELHSQLHNVVLRKTQNRTSLRNSIVMDPSALLYGQSQPAAVVHQSKPNTVHLVHQPRPQTSAFTQPRPQEERRNTVFDALNEHSNTLRKMSKPNIPRKPSFNESNYARLNDTCPKESVYGIMDNYMESRKSLGSQKSVDSEDSVDFPPPPPPMCDYNAVVDC